jgi:hypothetical protein
MLLSGCKALSTNVHSTHDIYIKHMARCVELSVGAEKVIRGGTPNLHKGRYEGHVFIMTECLPARSQKYCCNNNNNNNNNNILGVLFHCVFLCIVCV